MELNEKLAARRRELAAEAATKSEEIKGPISYSAKEYVYMSISIVSGLFLLFLVYGLIKFNDLPKNYGTAFFYIALLLVTMVFTGHKAMHRVFSETLARTKQIQKQ